MARKTFAEWIKEVDKILIRDSGLSSNEMDDSPYSIWYQEGMRPTTAAKKALKNAGW